MSGDWIKMRGNLWDDPRIARLVDITDSSEAAVIGGLYWLWAAADQHTTDGIMPGLSTRQIDRKTGVQGLGQALVDIGWIADHPEGVRIVNFEEHNGASAKKRAQTAKRVANHKAGNAQESQKDESGNAPSVSTALPREEKRREEEKEIPPNPRKRGNGFDAATIELPDWLDADDWQAWVKDRKDRKKQITEQGAKQQLAKLNDYRHQGHSPHEVIANSIAAGYQGLFPASHRIAGNANCSTAKFDPLAHINRNRTKQSPGGYDDGIIDI